MEHLGAPFSRIGFLRFHGGYSVLLLIHVSTYINNLYIYIHMYNPKDLLKNYTVAKMHTPYGARFIQAYLDRVGRSADAIPRRYT